MIRTVSYMHANLISVVELIKGRSVTSTSVLESFKITRESGLFCGVELDIIVIEALSD